MLNTFKNIWQFSNQRHKNMITALVLSFLRSVFGLTQIGSIIIAINVIRGNADVKKSVIAISILTVICIIGNFATSYFEQTNTLTTGFFMTADKRVTIGNLLKKMPLGFFNDNSSGKICASLTTTLSGIETAATMVMIGIVSGLFNAFSLFLFMMFYDWRIGLISGAGMVSYLLLVNYQMKVSRKNAPKLQNAQTKLAESSLTFLQGIKVTKAFSYKDGDKQLKQSINDSKDANIGLTNTSMPSQFAAGICVAVFESIILIVSLVFCFESKNLDIVKAIVLIIFSFMVYASLNQAGSMLSMIGLLDSGINELSEIENAEQLKQEMPQETAKNNNIEFKNVSFAYGENEVLHNISIDIKDKSLTALIGPSGSGKTTLCQLIPRFRDIKSGTIKIGGADIKHLDDKELMEKISIVFQNVYLFEDTVLNNIRFGKPDASMEEVIDAAKKARCHDFIKALPNGYDTMIGEGGNSLSGGEKQRISIARAILKDSPIIILDEATSALDAENEHDILKAIDELTKNKTVIMIAHRIKTVEKADHIIAIDNGKIVQEGTHEELKNTEGLYKNFLNSRETAKAWQL